MSRPWMPLYVSDYLGDTGHLSTVEHGAYLLLIMHYWQAGSLPGDDAKLARICRLHADEWAAIRETIAEFFDEDWTHGRIEAEMAKASEIINKRSAAGKAGASARYGKCYGKRSDLPKQTHSHPQPHPPSHLQEELEKDISSDFDSDFEAWYAAYPRHEAKGQARKAYRTARKKADGGTLLAGAHNASARYVNSEKRFIPSPATWLNGERWLDDPPPPDEAKPKALTPAEEVDEMYRQMGIRKTW